MDYFLKGIECFNKGDFYEAHEEWEHVWLRDQTDSKLFYQGLIQVAAGFLHHQKGRVKECQKALAKGIEKLSHYAADFKGIDLQALREAARQFDPHQQTLSYPHLKRI